MSASAIASNRDRPKSTGAALQIRQERPFNMCGYLNANSDTMLFSQD